MSSQTPPFSLPPEVRAFLDSCIRTIEDLEILMLVRSQPTKAWNSVDVSREMGMDRSLANNHLMWLYLNGILKLEPTKEGISCFRYAGRSAKDESVMTALAGILLNSRKDLFLYLHRT